MASPLSANEQAIVQSALDLLTEEALRHGLNFTLEHDFEEFARLRKLAGDGGCYPTVDPGLSRVTPENAFWLRVTDADDNLVAMMAERFFECDDFLSLFRNLRVWFDRRPTPIPRDYAVLDAFPGEFGGVVGHGCGLWVHPSMRGRGLAAFLPDYYRAVSLRVWQADWLSCLVFKRLEGLALRGYRYREIGLIIDGYFPVTGAQAEVYLCRIPRADMIEDLKAPRLCLRATEEPPRVREAVAG